MATPLELNRFPRCYILYANLLSRQKTPSHFCSSEVGISLAIFLFRNFRQNGLRWRIEARDAVRQYNTDGIDVYLITVRWYSIIPWWTDDIPTSQTWTSPMSSSWKWWGGNCDSCILNLFANVSSEILDPTWSLIVVVTIIGRKIICIRTKWHRHATHYGLEAQLPQYGALLSACNYDKIISFFEKNEPLNTGPTDIYTRHC